MAQVVDYATPERQRRRPVWLIVLVSITVPALLAGVVMVRQRHAAVRAIQAQQAAQRAAQAARQQQAALQQQQTQTRPAAPQVEPSVEQP